MSLPPYSTYFTQCLSIQWSFFHHHFKSVITLGFQQNGDFDSVIPSIVTSWHSSTKKTFLRIPTTCLFKKKKFMGLFFIIFNSM